MKVVLTKGVLLIAFFFFITACNGNGGKGAHKNAYSTELPTSVESALNSEKYMLNKNLANTISYMGNEERLAYDVYNRLYSRWGIKQFINISTKFEYKHITAVQRLVQKYKISDDVNFTNIDMTPSGYMNTPIEEMKPGTYDISKIQNLYNDLVSKGLNSEIDALEVGCMVEVTDINDLNRYLEIAKASNAVDVEEVFTFLRQGSYNHYRAFDRGLKNRGVSDGCCSLGSLNGVNYCHPEYPQR